MIFEELRIFGCRRQLLDEKLAHIDQFVFLHDPKIAGYAVTMPSKAVGGLINSQNNLDNY